MSDAMSAAALRRADGPPTLAREDEALLRQRMLALEQHLCTIIQGKREVLRNALVAVLAQGHILLEDVPGVGKTTLALALASGLGCTFARIQFTSDLLPTDILGVSIFNQQQARFEFRGGPIFNNVVLADELNRTTPKTQSCLLEAMSEGVASIDGVAHAMPDPFLVIATQNPLEHHGTFPLPESQLDRFMMRLRVGYPDAEAERRVLRGISRPAPGQDEAILTPPKLLDLQERVREVSVERTLEDYILAMVSETRTSSTLALGVSPRGAQFLYQAAQARAFLEGRSYVIPDDIKKLTLPVLAHRIIPGGMVGLQVLAEESESLLSEVLDRVPAPD